MADRPVKAHLKMKIKAGAASAAPPVGSTLGQYGVNMMDFINPFNDATKDLMGKDVIVHIQVYEDRSFTWNSLGQPVDDLIREAAGIKKGSAKPHTDKVGTITRAQLEEIAEIKKDQLNAIDVQPQLRRSDGRHVSTGASTDHDQVMLLCRRVAHGFLSVLVISNEPT